MNNLRPLSIGEILDVAFKLYGKHWARFAAMIAVVVIPVEIINGLIRLSTIDSVDGNSVLYSDKAAYNGGQVVIGVLAVVINLFVVAVAFRAVSQAYMGQDPSISGSLRFAARRVHSLLWLYVLLILGLVIGFLLLIIPGIYLWGAWSVAVPVLMVEGMKGSKALGRSRALVRGRWWEVFAVLVVSAVVIQFTASLAVGVLGGLILANTSSLAVYVLVNGLVTGIVEILVAPVIAAVTTVLYYDLRVRKEAFDVSLMIDALGLPGGDGVPAPTIGVAGLPDAPAPADRPADRPAPPARWEPPGTTPAGTLPAGWAPPVAPDVVVREPAAPEPPPEPPKPPPPPDPMPDPFNAG